MTRHPENPNLTIHYDSEYLGLPLMSDKGPFIYEYLNRLHQTIDRALDAYREVFAFRFDLNLPAGYAQDWYVYQNEIIDRFIESFKAKIEHNRWIASQENKYAHNTKVRFVWAREASQDGGPHYHFVIMLNWDAFRGIGIYNSERRNLFKYLEEAWASALRIPVEAVRGAVNIPHNARYRLSQANKPGVTKFFERASYLCKVDTKSFGYGGHGFGASRT